MVLIYSETDQSLVNCSILFGKAMNSFAAAVCCKVERTAVNWCSVWLMAGKLSLLSYGLETLNTA